MIPAPRFASPFPPLCVALVGTGFLAGTPVGNLGLGLLVGLVLGADLVVGLVLGSDLVVGLVLEADLEVGLVLRPDLIVGLVLGLTLPCITTGPRPSPPKDNVTRFLGAGAWCRAAAAAGAAGAPPCLLLRMLLQNPPSAPFPP